MGDLSTIGTIGKVMTAASTAVTTGSTIASSAQQRASQKAQLVLSRSQSSLAQAEQEKEREEDLSRTLARQGNWYAAKGVDQGSGSAFGIASAAQAQAEQDLGAIRSRAGLAAEGLNLTEQKNRRSRRLGSLGSLLKFGSSW